MVFCEYLYITKNGLFARFYFCEEEREASARVLVMYCTSSLAPFSNGVPRKGADAEGCVVECMRQNVLWLAHSRVTIGNDNAPALAQVVERAIAAPKMSDVEQVVEEVSVPYDPQTNCVVESVVRLAKGTLKASLKSVCSAAPHEKWAIFC